MKVSQSPAPAIVSNIYFYWYYWWPGGGPIAKAGLPSMTVLSVAPPFSSVAAGRLSPRRPVLFFSARASLNWWSTTVRTDRYTKKKKHLKVLDSIVFSILNTWKLKKNKINVVWSVQEYYEINSMGLNLRWLFSIDACTLQKKRKRKNWYIYSCRKKQKSQKQPAGTSRWIVFIFGTFYLFFFLLYMTRRRASLCFCGGAPWRGWC